MRNKMAAKVSNCFLFLVIGFVILSSSVSANAQIRIPDLTKKPPVTVNLAGTSWVRSPQSIAGPGDGTVITLSHRYDFEQNGIVKYTLITTKPAGQH